MTEFLFVYFGGDTPQTETEQQSVMAAWTKWMNDEANNMSDPGNPVGRSYTADGSGSKEGSDHPIMGYSIYKAPDLETALKVANSSPHVTVSKGYIEVTEIIPMG